jgi:hypothetical protein
LSALALLHIAEGTTMIPDDSLLWAARRQHARRHFQAGNHDLRGYPALLAEEETEETLAAKPRERGGEKQRKPTPVSAD